MYHWQDDVTNRTGANSAQQPDITQAPIGYPVGAGGPTFHGYRSDDDPSYPGPE